MSKFGYLNQSNPIFIAENEAQEMVNCKIDRGWLEFGEFKVNTGLYDAAPGRQVNLPNGKKLVIDPLPRNPLDGGVTHASRGQVREDIGGGNTKLFWVPTPASGCIDKIQVVPTLSNTHYELAEGNVATSAGKFRYVITLYEGSNPLWLTDEQFFFKWVHLASPNLEPSQFSWRAGELGTSEAGKVILTLNFDPGDGKTIYIRFHFYPSLYKSVVTRPGKYFFAITYIDKDNNTESPPYFKEVEILDSHIQNYSGECFLELVDLRVDSSVPIDISPWIRAYRIPFGGTEYLLAHEIQPGVLPETFFDSTPDHELGVILSTEGNTNLPLESKDAISIALHKEKLFIGIASSNDNQGYVYYSKTSQFNEFKAEFFFHFGSVIVAMAQFNECLAIFTKTEAYILYGDNEASFSLSKIDFVPPTNAVAWKSGFSINSAQAIAGSLIALAKSSNKKTDSFLLFNSRYAVEASLPIRELLNTEGWIGVTAGEPTLYHPLSAANRNLVIDNRFYVFELMDGDQRVAIKTLNVVYDSIMRGFCVYDASCKTKDENNNDIMLFKWRSKEFHVDASIHGVQFHKRVYVRGSGKFTVEILGDGEVITTDNFDLDQVQTCFFQISSHRYTTFSIRFVGYAGAQIHDWGVASGNN